MRRNFFALLFMTVVPTVTWPSEPMATRFSRLTHKMVVDRMIMMRISDFYWRRIWDARDRRPRATDRWPNGYTFAWWSTMRGRAFPEWPGDPHLRRANAWRMNASGRAG